MVSDTSSKSYEPREAMKQTPDSWIPKGPVTTVPGHTMEEFMTTFRPSQRSRTSTRWKPTISFVPDHLAEASDRNDTICIMEEA